MSENDKRTIIREFAEEIRKNCLKDDNPETAAIPFRTDMTDNIRREVCKVRTSLLRFRKDNGRIACSVLSYEKENPDEPLIEQEEVAQNVIKGFLKDEGDIETLQHLIQHDTQKEPAIITADGFLINGNRRKLALDLLYEDTREEKFQWMKVVMLPGDDDQDEGGPPTIKEIEKIENKCQLQSDGRNEYTSFDRALTYRRKIKHGIPLDEQLRDDPEFASLKEKEFEEKKTKYEKKFLRPLECIDEYLEWLNRNGLYNTVSGKSNAKKGRWEAFLDYYKRVYKHLENPDNLEKKGIDPDEAGDVQDIAFKIIRKQEFPGVGDKPHEIMRNLLKWYKNKEARKSLREILKVDRNLPEDQKYDSKGGKLSEEDEDKRWAEINSTTLIRSVKQAKQNYDRDQTKEAPLTLLDAALNKIKPDKLDPNDISICDAKRAMEKCKEIKERANELESDFYAIHKNPEKLLKKHGKK